MLLPTVMLYNKFPVEKGIFDAIKSKSINSYKISLQVFTKMYSRYESSVMINILTAAGNHAWVKRLNQEGTLQDE
jgi:hypothetical protein